MFYDWKSGEKSYREIEEEAVFHIPREYPEWTDYNAADPGITLVQLFSWLTEVQQYHLSQPDERKRRKYLKLLGTGVRHISPAAGAVSVEYISGGSRAGLLLLKGSRFLAQQMIFETVRSARVRPVRLTGAYMTQGDIVSSYHNTGNEFEKQMKLYPFGERPKKGNQCCFLLDAPFIPGRENEIYFDICTEYEVARNPADQEFLPLAELGWEYLSDGGWKELTIDSDATFAFLQSGKVCFSVPENMAEAQGGGYQLRVTLLENDLDVAPLIYNIYLNEIEVRQQETLCDYEDYEIDFSGQEEEYFLQSSLYLVDIGATEIYVEAKEGWKLIEETRREKTDEGEIRIFFRRPAWAKGVLRLRLSVFEAEMEEKRIVGIGDAFANQEFELHMPDIVYDDFEIAVYDRERDCYIPYEKREDFDGCSPEDAAYILDMENKKLIFGNCERGMAPGGEIRILRLRQSLGSAGNIKADKIRECQPQKDLRIRQYKSTSGGQDEESVSECLERFRRDMQGIHRGVTYADYEELVKKAPGLLILDSRVIPPAKWEGMGKPLYENQISIVVQPVSFPGEHAVLSERYRQNLRRILENRKMLGTRIRLLNPEYAAVSVYAEIVIKPQFLDAEAQIKTAVKEYLNEKTWKIGSPVLSSTLYGALDTLPCVSRVKTLTLSAKGSRCRHLVNGDIALPPNGLADLSDLDLRICSVD